MFPKLIFIAILIFQMTMAWAADAADDMPVVLRIRPDKIVTAMAAQPEPVRNPFNWSEKQISAFKRLQEEKIDYFAGLSLQGIIWNKKKPFVVINNQIVAAGDRIQDARVIEIYKEEILLEHDGVFHTLFLSPLVLDGGDMKDRPATYETN
ncbi:MAG: hypothetical protein U9R66_05165 [Thermodesulfobacteriota bacterium]|nr:hypothetical protein [Thermodesulfobacteriota bacterium]